MIDLHAHVLPGIDDGPATMDEALALLKAMEEQGVRRVVAAAHALDGRYNATREAVLAATEAVNSALQQTGAQISVLPGMELYLTFDLLQALKSGKVMGLAHTPYVVVELPGREFPRYTDRALYELLLAGYRPILNHPERNAQVRRNPDLFYRLADRGIPAMVTASSLLGRFGSEAQQLAEEFIAEGVAPYLVSDAHDLKGRAPMLPQGLEAANPFGKRDQAPELALLA